MDRYGNDFGRDRWGGEPGWQSGRGMGRGGEFGGFRGERGGREEGYDRGWTGGGRSWMNDYDAEFDAWGGEPRGRYGSDYRGMGGRGGFGGRYGGEFGQGGQGQGGGWGGGMGGQRFGRGEMRGAGGWMEGGRSAGYGGGYGGSTFETGYGGYQESDEGRGGYGGGWATGRGGREDEGERVRVSEIMTEEPESVTADTTLADAARKMRDLDVGIIPVVESQENRRLRGVVTDRDIAIRAVAEGGDASKMKVADVMTTDVETCNKNDTARDVMGVMQREQLRRVPITDREGRLVGIVAQADLAVDLMGERPGFRHEVSRTLRRVSEPGEPQRAGMQARGRETKTASRRPQEGKASQKRGEEA